MSANPFENLESENQATGDGETGRCHECGRRFPLDHLLRRSPLAASSFSRMVLGVHHGEGGAAAALRVDLCEDCNAARLANRTVRVLESVTVIGLLIFGGAVAILRDSPLVAGVAVLGLGLVCLIFIHVVAKPALMLSYRSNPAKRRGQ